MCSIVESVGITFNTSYKKMQITGLYSLRLVKKAGALCGTTTTAIQNILKRESVFFLNLSSTS